MVKVSIYKDENNEYAGFQAYDHAGAGVAGEDVVCAAVSMLVINTINAIDSFTDTEVSVEADAATGKIDYRIQGVPSKEATLLLDTMVLGLQSLEDDEEYAAYVDLIFEEV